MTKKIKITMITLIIVTSAFSGLKAQNYPSDYLGSGYREYLSEKMQEGYHIEVFTRMDMRQKERVNKRNGIEELVSSSYEAGPKSSEGILSDTYQQQYNFENLKNEIANLRKQREGFASTNLEGGFNYIPFSDGSVQYFKNGLLVAIQNEKVFDEMGNVNIKNTFNMKYSDKRLLMSYEAFLSDNLNNATKLFWYGAEYSPDSVFYGNDETKANKNLTRYSLKEIDSAGNEKITHWNALSYEGKMLRAFSQIIEDSIYGRQSFSRSNINYLNNNPKQVASYREEGIGQDGLSYALNRNNIAYNGKNQVTGYREERFTTQLDGYQTKETVDAKFKYLEANRKFGADVENTALDLILESDITTTTENLDGLMSTVREIINYSYSANQALVAAKGRKEFSGQESDGLSFIDKQGRALTQDISEEGDILYFYFDPGSQQYIIVNQDQVTAIAEEGNRYMGSYEVLYEILCGQAMIKQEDILTFYYSSADNSLLKIEATTNNYNNGLVNNLQRVLGKLEHTEISRPMVDLESKYRTILNLSLDYVYDTKGNLIDAYTIGNERGWEYDTEKGQWLGQHEITIEESYEIILGRPLIELRRENKNYLY